MFNITHEEALEIVETYGGSLSVLRKIQNALNLINIIDDEEEFKLLVCEIISQYESIQLYSQINKDTDQDLSKNKMSLTEIIIFKLLDKYDMFQEFPNKKIKFNEFVKNNKNRHK